MSRLAGIWGRPYIDLQEVIDIGDFTELDREITLGLCRVEPTYTGGSLKWMNVVAPWVHEDPYADYGNVIERFSSEEFADFVSLAEDPSQFDLGRQRQYEFGDETPHPLSRAQALFLKYRHGVYFPWKVCYHLLENDRWEDKHIGAGKAFGQEALREFPRTIEFIKSLPFKEIGRAVIFGLEANDHALLHRDSEPGVAISIAQSISFDPRGSKRFYLSDPAGIRTEVTSPIYWFNDMDYHGVLSDPFFRYSIRVDGVFDPSFCRELEARTRAGVLRA